MLLVGCTCFGLVLGWSGGFVGTGARALAWRLLCATLVPAGLVSAGWPAVAAALAGIVAGTIGHEAFAYGIRVGRAT